MVNTLRLSPLNELRRTPQEKGAHPAALALFVGASGLLALGLGLHFLGDKSGGSARVELALDAQEWDYHSMLRLLEGTSTSPVVLRGRQGDAAEPDEAPERTAQDMRFAALDNGNATVVRVVDTGDDDFDVVVEEAEAPAPPRTRPAANVALSLVPNAALVTEGPHGPLPIIAADGRRPAQVYARPFDRSDTRPRVSLVIGGLGLNAEATQAAIESLPADVTLSFAPYAENLQRWIDTARAYGHEVLIEFPMEPFDYPNVDPGPATLLTAHTPEDRADKLAWLYGRATGYVGVMNYQGARFTASEAAFAPVLEDLTERGLLYLDDGSSQRSLARRLGFAAGGAIAVANRRIDLRPQSPSIASALEELEATAEAGGVAIGVGFAYPVTVAEIVSWTETLESRGLVLAPLSAVTVSETS